MDSKTRILQRLSLPELRATGAWILGAARALVPSAIVAVRRLVAVNLQKKVGRQAKTILALTRLHETASRLWLNRDLNQALDDILKDAIELLGADKGNIQVLDSERGTLKIVASRGFDQDFLDVFREASAADDTVCGRALRSGKRLVVEDVESDAPFALFRPAARAADFRAVQSTPIMSRGGVPLGMLSTHFRSVHRPTEEDLLLLDLYVRQVGDIIERHGVDNAPNESAERLRVAHHRTSVGIWERDLRTGKLTWTPQLEVIFGLEPGGVRDYADFRDRVHPDDVAASEAERDAAVRRGETFSLEYRIIRPDGQVRWILSVGGASYDEVTGEPVRILGNSVDITERKQAELILADRDAQLSLAGKAGLIGRYAYEVDTEMIQFSPGYAIIHGLPEGTTEIARSEWLALMHPEDAEQIQRLRSKAFREQQSGYNVEYRIVQSSREVRWIELRSIISYDRDRRAKRVIGVNIDITERKQAEALLKESKARLADALVAGQVVAFDWDSVNGRSQRSENAIEILGSEQSAMASTPRSDFLAHVHPDDCANLKTHVCGLRPGDPSYALSFRYVRPDGRQVWLEEIARGEFDATGKLLRIKGLTRDITKRKHAEVALQASEAKFAGILTIAGDAIVSIDGNHRITLFNEAAERLFGYSRGEMTGRPIDLLIPTRFRTAHQRHIECFTSGPDIPRRMSEQREVPGRRKNGEEFPIEASISKVKIGGEWVCTVVLRDITERKHAEERQRALLAELDHRVKNALATISAVASQTRHESRSVASFAEALDARILSMAATHELLSSGRWQGISLAEVVRRELAPYATRDNTEINGPDILLKSETGQAMAMVLHELTTNAAKYGALSTENGRVSIRWDQRPTGHSASRLVFEWQEIGGPPVEAPGQPSYGTTTIRDLIPYEFGGTVDLVFASDGVRCRLELPVNSLSNDSETVSEANAPTALETGLRVD
jgi:PAS domain S-box-containing protein